MTPEPEEKEKEKRKGKKKRERPLFPPILLTRLTLKPHQHLFPPHHHILASCFIGPLILEDSTREYVWSCLRQHHASQVGSKNWAISNRTPDACRLEQTVKFGCQ